MAKPAKFFKKLKDEKILTDKVKRAKKEIREATQEISKLMSYSKKGTLNTRTLESGLKKLSNHFGSIPGHFPHKY
jgi:hypothetical protein